MPVLYGIRNCDSCRKARKSLSERDITISFHDLREDGLDARRLTAWCDRAGWQSLLNTRSRTWRELPESARANMSLDRAVALMLKHPTLVKRPVLEFSGELVIGYSPETYAGIAL